MFPTARRHAPQHHIQSAVIGAGVVGLSVARSLACSHNHEVLIIEQNAMGSGISSRNSEVIHAGIYYDKDTMPLKSRLCVDGKKMMYKYCEERDVPYKRCGKLIVASDVEQREVGLPKLIEYAKRNGVDDLKTLSKEDVSAIEPNVVCEGAVLSPSTGIVDSHTLMTSLLGDAEECGATLASHRKVDGGYILPGANGKSGSIVLNVDGSEIQCDNVVVCAGLASDKIAADILSSITKGANEVQQPLPKQYFAKGNYFKLENQKSPFGRLIYPLPDPKGGLGIHATIDLAGSTKFGPDVQWLDHDNIARPDEMIDFSVDAARADLFYDAIRKYWPDLEDGNIVTDYAGIRPKLLHPNFHMTGCKDFVIAGKEAHGVSGLVVLLGIESPGLTSSLEIGEYVAKMLR
ncbi:hypothetical protein ACHAWO_008930 [Cyclotella atomus]|uniref:L-2-hydroxyglutarate dehydrogenase, mitochondrial n=1 Tax=Cyclotella atomus TaxID=382360 RepID=A0ABD3QGT3_9STRA